MNNDDRYAIENMLQCARNIEVYASYLTEQQLREEGEKIANAALRRIRKIEKTLRD